MEKEIRQIEAQIVKIQELVVQEIEPYIAEEESLEVPQTSNNGTAARMMSQISAIPEEEAGENTYTEGDECEDL